MIASPPIDLIDTHAHLDDEAFAGKIDQLLGDAAEVGVRRVINIGYRPAGWQSAIELAQTYPVVAFTLGIHPNHADEATPESLRRLRELLRTTSPVAIGEVGLDYYRDAVSPLIQRAAFAAQIELAAEFDLPLVIHQRAAEDDLIEVLRSAPPSLRFILHSFEGSARYLEAAIEREAAIGVGGLMTRPGSVELRGLIARAPERLLVLETDSPYLKPSGVRGSRNVPRNVITVARVLSELRGVSLQEIARLTTTNAERFFARLPSAATALRST